VKRQREIKSLENTRNTKRKSLFDAQDDIDRRRDALIENIEAKLKIRYTRQVLFEIEWRLR
jgi:adenine-specific DNA-methyltransferase